MFHIRLMARIRHAIGNLGGDVEAVFEFAQQNDTGIAGDLRFVETNLDPVLFQKLELQLLIVFEADIKSP